MQINSYEKKFTLEIIKNSSLEKKILKFINEQNDVNQFRVLFTSSKSYDSKFFDSIPDTKIVELSDNFKCEIDLTKLTKMTEIYIGVKFNNVFILPNSVKKISFKNRSKFDTKITKYPDSLIYLEFGYNYNQPIDNLPNKLEHLHLGSNFNHPIDNLPMGLKYLHLGYNYNHPIDNLPIGLKYLCLGESFNQSLDYLPESLTELKFNSFETKFTKSIDNLPTGIIKLSLPKICTKQFNSLTDNITHLTLFDLNEDIIKFPKKINILEITSSNNIQNFHKIKNCDLVRELIVHNKDTLTTKQNKALNILNVFNNSHIDKLHLYIRIDTELEYLSQNLTKLKKLYHIKSRFNEKCGLYYIKLFIFTKIANVE